MNTSCLLRKVEGPSAPTPHVAEARPYDVIANPDPEGWAGCWFPWQDVEPERTAVLFTLQAHVRPDGKATAIDVLESSDARFDEHAKKCALARRYEPGRNARGEPTTEVTAPFKLRFVR